MHRPTFQPGPVSRLARGVGPTHAKMGATLGAEPASFIYGLSSENLLSAALTVLPIWLFGAIVGLLVRSGLRAGAAWLATDPLGATMRCSKPCLCLLCCLPAASPAQVMVVHQGHAVHDLATGQQGPAGVPCGPDSQVRVGAQDGVASRDRASNSGPLSNPCSILQRSHDAQTCMYSFSKQPGGPCTHTEQQRDDAGHVSAAVVGQSGGLQQCVVDDAAAGPACMLDACLMATTIMCLVSTHASCA